MKIFLILVLHVREMQSCLILKAVDLKTMKVFLPPYPGLDVLRKK
jgi:hypothetical protein